MSKITIKQKISYKKFNKNINSRKITSFYVLFFRNCEIKK